MITVLQEIKVPQESVNDLSVTVMSVFFESGSKIQKGELLIELESSKATFTISSEADGYVEFYCQSGDEVKVGQIIANIFDSQPVKADIQLTKPNPAIEEPVLIPEKTIFSEKARQLLLEHHLKETDFRGFDFVSSEDIMNKIGVKKNTSPGKEIPTESSETPLKHHKEKIKTGKRREIEYLKDVQSAGLNSQVTIKVDITGIYKNLNVQFKYFKNSLLPIIIYECSRLLHKYPELNAFYTNEQIVIYDEVNVGVALDIDDGLKTVKLGNADLKNIQTIEEELMTLSEKYLAKTLTASELSGITFTITDLSSENIFLFTPLINKQNASILGISSVEEDKCCLTISFDHRITVGKQVANFLNELKTRIESYKSSADISKIHCYKCFKKLEEDFSEIGFLKVINKKGKESYICQTCLKGL